MAEIDNLKIAEQFNRLFSERRVMAAAVTREMRNQLELATQIATIVQGVKPEEIADKLAAVSKAMEGLKEKSNEAGDQAEKAMQAVGTGAKGAQKGATNLDKQMKLLTTKFPALRSVAAGAFTGLVQGFTNIIAMGKSATSMAVGFADGVWKIAKSIAAIPLKIYRGLIDLATDFSGDTSFLQALENLRKEFGNFKEDVSKNVLGAFKTAQAGVTGTGLATFRVLGTFAQQLEYFTEMAKGAGAQMHQFGDEIAQNAGKIIGFDKGLGVGAENIKAYMDRAKTYGTDLQEQFLKTANYSLQMGEAFGMSQKVLAKDISSMMKDVKNFGSLTQKEMSVAAIYTRKLGFEVKNLLGLVDKFDTFEDSANAAAQMSQAFGTATDAFKLMQEQDPAKRMDMLRKSMAAAGKTTENMSRQELKLLAQTSGLDEATAKLAFSAKNQGVSYDQIQKKAAEAENAPLRQAQALEKLAASIERVVQQGQMFKGGFIDQFLHGFSMGVKSSPAFIGAILSIRQALWKTMMMGVEVGKMFVKTFAGGAVADMFNGIKEAFQGWDKLMAKTKAAFASFFVDFDIRKLITNFQNIFVTHFSEKGSAGTAFASGFKRMFDGVAKVAASGFRFVIEELTKGLKRISTAITSYLKDPKAFMAGFDAGAENMQKGFMGMMKPLIDLVRDEKLWKELWGALTSALEALWKLVMTWIKGPTFQKLIGKVAPMMVMSLVAPAAIRGVTAGALSSITQLLLTGAKSAGEEAVKGAAKAGAANPVGPRMMTGILGNPYALAAAAVVAAGVIGTGFSKGISKFQDQLIKDTELKVGASEKKVGAATAGIVQLLSFGAISDEAALEMAKNFSKFADDMFKSIEKVFGPKLGKTIKDRFMLQLDFLSNFGDLITGIMEGNDTKAGVAIANMIAGVFKIAVNNMQLIFIDLPQKLMDWFIPAVDNLANYLMKSLDASNSGSIWEKVKPMLTNLVNLAGPLLEGLTKMLYTAFIKLPIVLVKLVGVLMISLTDTIAKAFVGLGKFIWNVLVEVLATLAEKTAGLFGSNIKNAMDKVRNTLKFGPKLNADDNNEVSEAAAKNRDEAMAASLASRPPPAALTTPDPAATGTDQATKLYQAQQNLEGIKALQELQKIDIQKTIDDAGAKINAIDLSKISTGVIDRVDGLNKTMNMMNDSLEKTSKQVEAKLAPTLKTVQDIISSVRELDNILASGDATRISVSKNLSKFANNSGLGGSGKYTIENKGIQINIDLKVAMNAEEMEEALVLRSKSIIKESIKKSLSISDDQLRDKIRNH